MKSPQSTDRHDGVTLTYYCFLKFRFCNDQIENLIVIRQVSTAHVTNGWCLLHCVVVFSHRVITGNHKLEKTNSTNSDPRPRENTLSNAPSVSIGLTLSTSLPETLSRTIVTLFVTKHHEFKKIVRLRRADFS